MATTLAPTSVLSVRRLRAHLRLLREQMARLLDVSAKTIERWEERDALPASPLLQTRLAKLDEIARLGLAVYTPEGLRRFLATPLPAFGGHTALQLIALDQAEQVLAALAADYEGLGY